jgi:glycosyltransferase involved in cell wall biosynthesis
MKPDKLLTIAIPTFNRSSILDRALDRILPQICKHSNYLEVIISDNASTDKTQEVIDKHKANYSDINIITNLQPHNTGYYGNFRTCREKSRGKYLWLLSDNEHISYNIIDVVINELQNNSDIACIYLKNKVIPNRANDKQGFDIYQTNFSDLIKENEAYRLTLTSSVIFLNIKDDDLHINDKYFGNLFLGFLYLASSFKATQDIITVEGPIYESYPCKVSFDVFAAWTKDITECLEYYVFQNIFSSVQKEQFVEGYLKANVYGCLCALYTGKKIHGITYSAEKTMKMLREYYGDNTYFKSGFKLFYSKSRAYLYIYFNVKILSGRIIRKIKRVLSSLRNT